MVKNSYTMQSDKNSRNAIYINKEHTHNILSLFFSIIGAFLMLLGLLVAVILNNYILIAYCSLFALYMLIRVVINFKLHFSFRTLVKKIEPEEIEFYITKSWLRKRVGAIWVGVTYILTSILFLAITAIVVTVGNYNNYLLPLIFIALHIIVVVVYMFASSQNIDSFLKISERRISLESIEWVQIRRDITGYYKLFFVWYVHLIFVVPLILMVIPKYRNFITDTFSK